MFKKLVLLSRIHNHHFYPILYIVAENIWGKREIRLKNLMVREIFKSGKKSYDLMQ